MKPRAPAMRRVARWLSLGGMVLLLALLVVHPDEAWAPHAPWLKDNTNEFATFQDFSLGERAPP